MTVAPPDELTLLTIKYQKLEEVATLLLAACEDMIESVEIDFMDRKTPCNVALSIETMRLAIFKGKSVL